MYGAGDGCDLRTLTERDRPAFGFYMHRKIIPIMFILGNCYTQYDRILLPLNDH